ETSQNLEKDFVLGSKETISYKKLYKDSLKVASYLKDHVGQNQNIVLISPNSVFFITAYLGILKSGNVCVPLNLAIEHENLDFILETKASSCVFMAKNLQSKQQLNEGIRHIDETVLNQIIETREVLPFDSDIDNNTLAEIIFTSGST